MIMSVVCELGKYLKTHCSYDLLFCFQSFEKNVFSKHKMLFHCLVCARHFLSQEVRVLAFLKASVEPELQKSLLKARGEVRWGHWGNSVLGTFSFSATQQ